MFLKRNYGVRVKSEAAIPKEVINAIAIRGSIVVVRGAPLVVE